MFDSNNVKQDFRRKETFIMVENNIVNSVLNDLKLGVIPLWQVRSTLEARGVCSFDLERLTKKVTETYEKEKPLL